MKRLAIPLLLAMLAGCASTEVQRAPTVVENPVISEARALAQEQAGLTGRARSDAAARIDTLLARLDDATLSREAATLPAGDPLYDFAGRALLNRGLPLPRPFDRAGWDFDAGGRPPADRDGYRPPLKVAVLLPLSGRQATVAASVRDGYLAGYYAESRRRPELRFYDTAAGAQAAYARAAADGNDLVVGPLAREGVDAVFANAHPPVPMLALNRGESLPPAGSASFSLSPEDEGIAAAEYLLDAGSRRVLVITGDEDIQRRAAQSLRTRLQARGDNIAGQLDYSSGVPLALPAGAPPDAVFLALKGNQARELAPRLALVGLGGVLRVATSQITSGTGKPAENVALDGITYPIESWTVRSLPGLPTPASAAARVQSARGPGARLFAFGYDAWLLTGYLERLALSANADLQGTTGRLRLDGFGNVLRRPAWSRFSGGVAIPVDDRAR